MAAEAPGFLEVEEHALEEAEEGVDVVVRDRGGDGRGDGRGVEVEVDGGSHLVGEWAEITGALLARSVCSRAVGLMEKKGDQWGGDGGGRFEGVWRAGLDRRLDLPTDLANLGTLNTPHEQLQIQSTLIMVSLFICCWRARCGVRYREGFAILTARG